MKEPWTEGTKPWWEKGYPGLDYLEASQVVSRVPCELVGIFLTCEGEVCRIQVFDGTNARQPRILDLQAGASTTIPFHPTEPIFCRRGLYLGLDDNVKSVTVQWRPLPAGWRP